MRLTVLGSGVCVPYTDRGNAGYVVQIRNNLILLDPGSGTIRKLVKAGYKPVDISIICITHYHPDHVQDLVSLIFGLIYDETRQSKLNISILAPAGFRNYFQQLKAIYHNWIDNPEIRISITECRQTTLNVKGIKISTFRTEHTDSSIAFKIEAPEGKNLIYTGDTDISEELFSNSRKSDCILTECSHSNENDFPGHMTPEKVSRYFKFAKPHRMVLTHFYSDLFFEDIIEFIRGQGIDDKNILLAIESASYEW